MNIGNPGTKFNFKKLRILCWNVNGIRAWHKKGHLEWLLKESPDIFCVQETKAHPEQLPEELRNPDGYHSYFDHSKGRKGYSGVAIFTKIKPDSVAYGIGVEELDQEGRFLGLFFGKLVIITTYFPNGGGGPARLDFKLRFYDAFLDYVQKLRKKGYSIVFCGDINTAHAEIDLARPKENVDNTGFLPIERAWLDRVVKAGYVDTYRHFNPIKTGAYTYWDMKTFARDRNVGWRIDYFFTSPDILGKVKKASILEDIYGSDHCPIELVLDFSSKTKGN
ncbi:MAG: exodeoxyribonuclease III [Candidatus Pacebacteria bacterium]|nr:exodeoxyribonuclease III [Candidatus Paceibacterota bacterium]